MASPLGTTPDASIPARVRRPFYKDPLSVAGWLLALAAIVGFWLFFVYTPTPRIGDAVARLTAVLGQVKRKPAAREAWNEARLAERLLVGDVVQTEPSAAAEISFDAGSVVRVR